MANKDYIDTFDRVIKWRARDEREMQDRLQALQHQNQIWNAEIKPEHYADYHCGCAIHQYHRRRIARLLLPAEPVQVYSPNVRDYSADPSGVAIDVPQKPCPNAHGLWLFNTLSTDCRLNDAAQARVDEMESDLSRSMWGEGEDRLVVGESSPPPPPGILDKDTGTGRDRSVNLWRWFILCEEAGRWADPVRHRLAAEYQARIGIAFDVADMRARKPIQYLYLLKAGYFEPIPVAWASQPCSPLRFRIDALEGWPGVTPTWRGYTSLAEERLYWVLNHRGSSSSSATGPHSKIDRIFALPLACKRMEKAVDPPPEYFSPEDTCMLQRTADGYGLYSKQVMPSTPFVAAPGGREEQPGGHSMILLDVSASMDWDPMRPVYDSYLVTGYEKVKQPKSKDVARSVLRRFTYALSRHDHRCGYHHHHQTTAGYDFVTFASSATHVGNINHHNYDAVWDGGVRFGGGGGVGSSSDKRIMPGWQMIKALHFAKHPESAVYHSVYGCLAGPATPMLRLLLVLDGEAQDMDEFELDLLSLSWAHVTIFLIGVDNCPHHHRHANELQRISAVNRHVSFVDAQGNCPERFVTHELLKRHLGYDMSLDEFVELECPPEYAS